ncbi:hypothetical protein A6A27_26675 [Micromonospora sp. CB01531]|nr:hypothetical protein A6A27_26675 [Micromonospora sp. CB01531]
MSTMSRRGLCGSDRQRTVSEPTAAAAVFCRDGLGEDRQCRFGERCTTEVESRGPDKSVKAWLACQPSHPLGMSGSAAQGSHMSRISRQCRANGPVVYPRIVAECHDSVLRSERVLGQPDVRPCTFYPSCWRHRTRCDMVRPRVHHDHRPVQQVRHLCHHGGKVGGPDEEQLPTRRQLVEILIVSDDVLGYRGNGPAIRWSQPDAYGHRPIVRQSFCDRLVNRGGWRGCDEHLQRRGAGGPLFPGQ